LLAGTLRCYAMCQQAKPTLLVNSLLSTHETNISTISLAAIWVTDESTELMAIESSDLGSSIIEEVERLKVELHETKKVKDAAALRIEKMEQGFDRVEGGGGGGGIDSALQAANAESKRLKRELAASKTFEPGMASKLRTEVQQQSSQGDDLGRLEKMLESKLAEMKREMKEQNEEQNRRLRA